MPPPWPRSSKCLGHSSFELFVGSIGSIFSEPHTFRRAVVISPLLSSFLVYFRYVDREGELRPARAGKGRTAHNGVLSSLSWKYRAGLKAPAEQ
jgi:hypothetical protein